MGIVEIIVVMVVALIVIPPENLPEVMRAVGKILRELRLASNTVMREISGVIDEPGRTPVQPPAIASKPGAVKPSEPAEPT